MYVAVDQESSSEGDSTRKNRILLKWNNFDSFILKSLSELYTRNELTDVTLVCKDVSFASHKVILAIWSPYFRDIFLNNPCKHPVIILQDVSGEHMEILLRFIYEGGVFIETRSAKGFLAVANLLKISGIEETRSQTAANISDSDDEDDIATIDAMGPLAVSATINAFLPNMHTATIDDLALSDNRSKSNLTSVDGASGSSSSGAIIISKHEVNFEDPIDSSPCVEAENDKVPFVLIASENVGNSDREAQDHSKFILPEDIGIDIDTEITETQANCIIPQHMEEEPSKPKTLEPLDDEAVSDYFDDYCSILMTTEATEPNEVACISSSTGMSASAAADLSVYTRILIMDHDDAENEDFPMNNLDQGLGSNAKEIEPLEAIESIESDPSGDHSEVKEATSESAVTRCTIRRKNVRQNRFRFHMKRKHKENVKCPLCGIVTKSLLVYKNHMNGHRRQGRRINHLNPVFRLCIT